MPSSDTQTQIEAAVLRRLLGHLREHTEVQNIDLMNLAGFCRNCIAKWWVEEAERHGAPLEYDNAREQVYGMAYTDWKRLHQRP